MTSNRPKALVTGASSGIGAATAVELARRGMAVAVHYFNNEEGARQTVQAIRDTGGYGSVMASNYNRRPFAPEVLVEGEQWRTIRRRQTIDDMVGLEE